MRKFTTITCAVLAATSFLVTSNFAKADSASTTAEIAQIKSLPAGAIPDGVKLAADQNYKGRIEGNPTSFDPHLVSDHISIMTIAPIFDPLVRQSENEKYIPCAAKSYDVSADGLTWTFHLRPDAKWQDGKPVTASDFVYSFRRLTDPKTASPYGNYLAVAHVANAQAINDGKAPVDTLGVKAVDDYTLQIPLVSPTPWLPQMLSYHITAPLRKDVIDKYGDTWTRPEHLIGNGPFKLTTYNVNDQVSYTKWDNYWNAKNTHLTSVTYYIIKNENTAYVKYLSGDLDLTELPASSKAKATSERPDEVVSAPVKGTTYFDFNNKVVPYVIRHAVALLTDSKFLTSKILKTNKPTTIFVPDYIQDAQGTTEAAYFDQDMKTRRAQAIKELEVAGYTKDHPYVLTLTFQNKPQFVLASNAFRAWIDKATGGRISYQTKTLEPKSFFAASNDHKFQVRLGGWSIDYDQASTFYNIEQCNDPNNYSQYCNPEYDKVVTKANSTLDENARVKLYQQANLILQKDLPVVPIFWMTKLFLRNPRLGGYNPVVFPSSIRDFYIIDGKSIKE